jgi:hypothetical protein
MGQRDSLRAAFPRTRCKSNALALTKDLKICAAAVVFIPIAINLAAVAMSSSFSSKPIDAPIEIESVVPKFSGDQVSVSQDEFGEYHIGVCRPVDDLGYKCHNYFFSEDQGNYFININGLTKTLKRFALDHQNLR